MSVNPNFGEVIEFHSGPAKSLYADWVGNIVSVRMNDGQTAWGLCMGVWVQCRELLSDESLVRNKSVIPISYEDRYRYSLTVIISARKTLGAAFVFPDPDVCQRIQVSSWGPFLDKQENDPPDLVELEPIGYCHKKRLEWGINFINGPLFRSLGFAPYDAFFSLKNPGVFDL